LERLNARIWRIASALAAAGGIGNAVFQAVAVVDLTGPRAVLTVAGALAPTLAVLVAWWIPSRPLRVAMLAVAMLLAMPALVIDGSALALGVEALLFTAVVAIYTERPARVTPPRKYSVVF
jgi:hypothetical protein